MLKNLKKFLFMGTLVLSLSFVMGTITYAEEIDEPIKEEEVVSKGVKLAEGMMKGIENFFKNHFNVDVKSNEENEKEDVIIEENISIFDGIYGGAIKGILEGIEAAKETIDDAKEEVDNVKDFTDEDLKNTEKKTLSKALLKIRKTLTKLLNQVTETIKILDTILEKMNVNVDNNDVTIEDIKDDALNLKDDLTNEDLEKIKEFMSKNLKLIKRGPCIFPRKNLIRPFN